jgi:TonB family protein
VAAAPKEPEEDKSVLVSVEQRPIFQGDFAAYMQQQLSPALKARKDTVEQHAIVVFVVKASGKVTDAELACSTGDKFLDAEAIRFVSGMPDWRPGRQHGRVVNVRMLMPITFKPDER